MRSREPFRGASVTDCWLNIGKTPSNDYKPFYFSQALMTADVELSDEMFIITKETADAYLKTRVTPPHPPHPAQHHVLMCQRRPPSALQWTLTKYHR